MTTQLDKTLSILWDALKETEDLDAAQKEINAIIERIRFQRTPTVLVHFCLDGGRYGCLENSHLFTPEKWEEAKKRLSGKRLYFGEIWGKHSEVYCDLDEDVENDAGFRVVTDHDEVLKFMFANPGQIFVGDHNLFNYIHVYNDGEGYWEEEWGGEEAPMV